VGVRVRVRNARGWWWECAWECASKDDGDGRDGGDGRALDTKTLARMHARACGCVNSSASLTGLCLPAAVQDQSRLVHDQMPAYIFPVRRASHECLGAVSTISKAYPVSASTAAPAPIALLCGHMFGTLLRVASYATSCRVRRLIQPRTCRVDAGAHAATLAEANAAIAAPAVLLIDAHGRAGPAPRLQPFPHSQPHHRACNPPAATATSPLCTFSRLQRYTLDLGSPELDPLPQREGGHVAYWSRGNTAAVSTRVHTALSWVVCWNLCSSMYVVVCWQTTDRGR
jgi:hypothetical protein